MRFLHAADLHIDSPLKGLDSRSNAPAEAIRRAPREAFHRLVDLAKKEQVDFVILAGDIFDGAWKDISTGIFFISELERLAPIPVYVVLGNHDSASTLTSTLTWPDHAYRFKDSAAETYIVPGTSVALHGQSFASRVVDIDLAAQYPDAVPGMCNIGILHTSLDGHAEHATYAPTTTDVLISKHYDAWCLGHVHERKVIRENPLILYPGNIQGRHIKESGARGCYIVDDAGGKLNATFHPLDSLRWEHLELDISKHTSYEEVVATAAELIGGAAEKHHGRQLCLRITLSGASAVDGDIRSLLDDFRGELILEARRHNGWVESVRIRSTPRMSKAEALAQGGIVGELFAACDAARSDGELRTKLSDALKPLSQKLPAGVSQSYGTKLQEAPVLDELVEDAELLLLSALAQ